MGDLRGRDLEPGIERLEDGHARVSSRGRGAGARRDPAAGDGGHGQRDDAGLVRGLGLDFYQPHWYDRFEERAPLGRHTATLDCDAPVVLGEFPTCNSARTPGELLATAEQSGYAGRVFLVGAGRRRLHTSRTGDRRRGGAQSLNRASVTKRGNDMRLLAKNMQTCSDSRRNLA